MGDALRAMQSRLHPDESYEAYLDSLTDSLVTCTEDAADRDDDVLATVLRQIGSATIHLRASLRVLRAETLRVSLAQNEGRLRTDPVTAVTPSGDDLP